MFGCRTIRPMSSTIRARPVTTPTMILMMLGISLRSPLLLNRRSRLQPGLCSGRIAKHREARIEVRAENRIHARHSVDHVVRGHEGRGPKGVAMAELAEVTHELPDLPSSHVRRSVARIDQLGYAKSVRRLLALQVSENVMQRDVAARGGAQQPLVRYVFDFDRHRGLLSFRTDQVRRAVVRPRQSLISASTSLARR